MPKEKSLKQKTIKGLIWSFGDLVANQGIQFIIQIILARLLLPEHFGLVGMILVFIAISNTIIDGGISQALIREQKVNQTDYSTVFYFNLLMACAVYVALFSLAPFIGNFFDESQLVLILRILSLGLIINSFSIIQRVQLTKKLDFRKQTQISVAAGVLSGGIAIVFASLDFGVWAIIINNLSIQIIQGLLLWILNGWRPSLEFDYTSFKRLFNFGSKLLLASVISTIYSNLFYVLIGRMYSPGQLGYYTNAVKLSDTASQSLTIALQRVTYPVFSSIQDNQEILKYNFRRTIKITTFINFPMMAGLATVAPSLINLLFGDKWMAMVIYFQLLCLSGMLYHLHAINLNILQVKGRSDLFLQLSIIKKIIFTLLILLAIWSDRGIIGLIVASIIDSCIAFLINTYYSGKEISYSSFEQLRDIILISLNTLIMAITVYVSASLLPDFLLLKLLLQILLGCFVYIAMSKLTRVQELMEVWQIITSIVSKYNKKVELTSK